MIHYLLLNRNGTVFQRGTCATAADIPVVPGTTSEVINPDDPRQPPVPPYPGYREHRAMAYPPIGDQLDALWKMMEQLGASSDMMRKIIDVKNRHPKE